uniref:DNA mismatch repair protein MSH5 n=1 Tax=Phaffia rhodozyma TaxID=264483 RepID=A0A1C9U6B7_PHARH|nr:DNA mismatch repair protein MSH5 [Phaffia rhodozyma]
MNMLTDTTRTTTPARTASHSRSISTVGTPGQSRKSTPSIRSKRPVKPSASKKERTVKRPKTPLGRDGKKLEEIDETESREGDEDNESESESEGSQVETTLVVCNAHSKVAAAYIDLVTDKLYIMEDVTDSSHFDTIDLVLHQIHPQMILVNSGAEDVLVEQLKAYAIAQNVKFEIQPQKGKFSEFALD